VHLRMQREGLRFFPRAWVPTKETGLLKENSRTMGNPQEKSRGTETRLHLEPHQIILRPLVTEKGVYHAGEFNQYAFEVNSLSTKDDIKRAVEELFNVKVTKVRTQNRAVKPRLYRYRNGYTKNWKKALVTLDKEHRIDFF